MASESAHMDQREHLTYRLQAFLQQAPISIVSLPLFPSGAQLELDSVIQVGPFPLRTFSLYDSQGPKASNHCTQSGMDASCPVPPWQPCDIWLSPIQEMGRLFYFLQNLTWNQKKFKPKFDTKSECLMKRCFEDILQHIQCHPNSLSKSAQTGPYNITFCGIKVKETSY